MKGSMTDIDYVYFTMWFVTQINFKFRCYPDRCPFIEKTLWNILEERSKAHKSKRFCDVPLFGETPDFDKVVLAAVRNGTTNTSSVSESLYNTAINILVCYDPCKG